MSLWKNHICCRYGDPEFEINIIVGFISQVGSPSGILRVAWQSGFSGASGLVGLTIGVHSIH